MMKKDFIFNVFIMTSLIGSLFVTPIFAKNDVDLKVIPESIRISKEEILEGEVFRAYATIENLGEEDIKGAALFFQNDRIIGHEQPFSILGKGKTDVFLDISALNEPFKIKVKAIVQGAQDTFLENNEAESKLVKPLIDSDGDRVPDHKDNCPSLSNPGQFDDDNDGIGNPCDDNNIEEEQEFKSVEEVEESKDNSLNVLKTILENLEDEEKEQLLNEESVITIEYDQLSWDTFNFYGAIDGIQPDLLTYSWWFGDGETASGANVQHMYGLSGDYSVKLEVKDPLGNKISAELPIKASFFHLGNFKLWLLLLVMIFISAALIIVSSLSHQNSVKKKKKRKKKKKS